MPLRLAARELAREARFGPVWNRTLDQVFADVAPYYDRANDLATLGLCDWFRRGFFDTIDVSPGLAVLDVCAGTNAVGIALLEREPRLSVHAIDRSAPMQHVGRERAAAKGLKIRSVIGDVHKLPFADDYFDVVTLQFASRHLGVKRVFAEIHRVLKPGGRFHHCDMLRPDNAIVEELYCAYLRLCVGVTAFIFGSGQAARDCKKYFVDALQMFYSADELSAILRELGFRHVQAKIVFAGMVASHASVKPARAIR